MGDIAEIIERIVKFRDQREWAQFHNGKDLSICLSVEASELLELFLWKNEEEVDQEKLKDELADVFYSAFLLAHHYQLDVKDIIVRKLEKNQLKYPVKKSRGSKRKYNEL